MVRGMTRARGPLYLRPGELVAELRADPAWVGPGTVVVVPVDEQWPLLDEAMSLRGVVVVGRTAYPELDPAQHPGSAWCDMVVPESETGLIDAVAQAVERAPLAASFAAQLLRNSPHRAMPDGLLLESIAYSALQSGPEFKRWLHSRVPKSRPAPTEPVVLVYRDGPRMEITLNRPSVRNALNTDMRNALVEILNHVALDEAVQQVTIRGAGPCYSAGGDLDEFGSYADPASAHRIRLASSVGRALAAVRSRVTVEVHGACVGSGIEIPAFARKIVADPAARFSLPELGLGLIPGAGGTWSIPRRIGRHRAAMLALSGETIDAYTALDWGLVDEVRPWS